MEHATHKIQETSLMALKKNKKKLGEREALVFDALTRLCYIYGDATDSEITHYLDQKDPNFVRPRRYDLVNKYKLVGYSQKRKCKITGETCLAWRVLKRKQ